MVLCSAILPLTPHRSRRRGYDQFFGLWRAETVDQGAGRVYSVVLHPSRDIAGRVDVDDSTVDVCIFEGPFKPWIDHSRAYRPCV